MLVWIILSLCVCGIGLCCVVMERGAEKERKRHAERLASLPVAVQIRYRLLANEAERLVMAGSEALACRNYGIAMSCHNQSGRALDEAKRLLNSARTPRSQPVLDGARR